MTSIESYGNYQLLKRLATGGMAQIFLARQGTDPSDTLLVLKRILPHLAENDDFIRMFLDEARIAARLAHPNIVQIFDLGARNDSYFIAMEYIHGEDVRRVWKRADSQGKTFPVELVCRVIMEACSGLDYAHKKTDANGRPLGIVHRDVSPQNILITFEGGVKIVDFGIAKAVDQATVTKSGVLKGKYSYMSPEQAAGKRLDARSDIFALGVVLYELLTGTRLFKRHNEIQTLNAVTACKVQPPSAVNARLPRELDAIVLKALAKSPDDRYQDALGLRQQLERWIVSSGRDASAEQLSVFMRSLYADRLAKEAQEGIVPATEMDAREDPSPAKKKKSGRILPRMAPSPPRNIADDKSPVVPFSTDEGASRALEGLLARVGGDGSASAATVVGEPTDFEVASATDRKLDGSWHTRPLMTPPPKPVSRWKTVSLAVGVVVFVFAGVAVYLLRHKLSLRDRLPVAVYPESVKPPSAVEPPPPEVKTVQRITLTIRSDPGGASVSVDGVASGRTPLALELSPEKTVKLLVQAPGHQDFEKQLTLTGEPFQSETVTLAPAPKPSPEPPAASGDGAASVNASATTSSRSPLEIQRVSGSAPQTQSRAQPPPRNDPPPRSSLGTVRFAVTPWAEVSCGRFRFGSTPFPDKQLPPGIYECVFSNPQHGSKSQRIEVRANETSKITVKF